MKAKDNKVDLSVILTAHNEGILAHKTMQSVLRAVKQLKDAGLTYELIIHIDNGDSETQEYFVRYHDKKIEGFDSSQMKLLNGHFEIFENNFGDLGMSRNFAIQKSAGKYVAILDLDDLISKNYFLDAVNILKKRDKEKLVLHVDYCISFFPGDDRFLIQKETNSVSKLEDAKKLALRNLWGSFVVSKKETFIKHPYIVAKDGIGFEDWNFNIATVNAGYRHECVPNSIYLYRRKADSLLTRTSASVATADYSPLFDFDFVAKAQIDEIRPTEEQSTLYKAKKAIVSAYVKLRSIKLMNAVIAPLAGAAKNLLGRKLIKEVNDIRIERVHHELSDSIISEWKELADIETAAYPSKHRLGRTDFYAPEDNIKVFNAYIRLCREAKHQADYVFVVPWLVKGGVEKLLLNYLTGFQKLYPSKKIAVVATLDVEHVWRDKIPNNTVFINFGHHAKDLNDEARDSLFSRLILQLHSPVIHNMNSRFCYEWAARHKQLIKGKFKFYCSIFGFSSGTGEFRERIMDYADPFMVNIDGVIDKIFTDNSCLGKSLTTRDGFNPEKFIVEHQACTSDPDELIQPTSASRQKIRQSDGKYHVLWASRIVSEKNPEAMLALAKKLKEIGRNDIIIDMYGQLGGEYAASDFAGRDNLVYHGAYDGIDSLDPSRFDCFVYSSLMDGMPNILLEVARFRLPIVSTGAGGITDFIENDKTGVIVNDPLNAQEYADAILGVLSDKARAEKLANSAFKKLEKEFSWNAYLDVLRRDFADVLGDIP